MACAERATGPEPTESRATVPSFQNSQGRQKCDGTLPPGTYKNVYVPPGAFCTLENSRVEGNLTVFEGAFLTVEGSTITGNLKLMKESSANVINTSVEGNLDGNQIRRIESGLSVVHGNVVIKNSSGADTQIELSVLEVMNGDIRIFNNNGTEIELDFSFVHNGSVDIRKNTVTTLLVQESTVAGDMDVIDNQTTAATVILNTVAQTLRCFDNTGVFVGGPNVAGNAEGQCFVGATP
jgi:hypothetical protein